MRRYPSPGSIRGMTNSTEGRVSAVGATFAVIISCVLLFAGRWSLAAVLLGFAIILAGLFLRAVQRPWVRVSTVALVAFNVFMYLRWSREMERLAAFCAEKYGIGLDCLDVHNGIDLNFGYVFPWYLGALALAACWAADHLWVARRARRFLPAGNAQSI